MSLQAFIGIKCEQDLKEQLERLAEQENRKLSDYVRLILKRHVSMEQSFQGQTKTKEGAVK